MELFKLIPGSDSDCSISVIVEEYGNKVMKTYEIIDGVVTKTLETVIDDDFTEALEEIENREVPVLEKRDDISVQAPCIYGNWCGPGCSGPKKPISKVDACCQSHDKCYGKTGYFACSCDKKLKKCLAPYVSSGSQWAILIWAWFKKQPCNPFK